MVIYYNNKGKKLSHFPLFLLQFFIHTDLLVQVANYITNKRKGAARQIAFKLRTNKFTDFNKQYA
ncbi:hypothetical protein AC785_01080 [Helicobacter pylori]|nr:hypothetical protein AC785_01080 [Helicobacter pylori]